MGFLDRLFGIRQPPMVTSILPMPAKNEIMSGRLPILNSDSLFPKKGEKIHLIDKAVSVEVKKTRVYRHVGISSPGLFKGHRINTGRGKPIEREEMVYHAGILYITNQRIVFHSKEHGFDKGYRYLTAIEPYNDGIELQFGNKTYSLLVCDGIVVNQALQLIKQKRSAGY